MDALAAIQQRRSVKHYDAQFAMPAVDKDLLLDLALLSPTSFNIQNWRLVVVDDPEQKKRLRAAAWGQEQVETAQLVIVLCADLKAWDKEPARYWRNAPPEVGQNLAGMIRQFYSTAGETVQRDEAMRSCGIAAQTLMIAAKAMGYDSCPMVGFDPAQVGEIIALPPDHVIGLLVVIGKAAQPARERGGQLDKSEVVVHNRFPA